MRFRVQTMIVRYYYVLLLLKLVVLFLCAEDESDNNGKATLFVSGAKPNGGGGGKGGKGGKDSIGLEQLRTKLSIAESAIAKVTQEMVVSCVSHWEIAATLGKAPP